MKMQAKKRAGGFALVSYLIGAVSLVILVGTVLSASQYGRGSSDRVWVHANALLNQTEMLRSVLMECASRYGGSSTGAFPAFPATGALASITCPADGQVLLAGRAGAFVPVPPAGLSAWSYVNDATSVRLELTGNATDPTHQPILDMVASRLGGAAQSTSAPKLTVLVVKP